MHLRLIRLLNFRALVLSSLVACILSGYRLYIPYTFEPQFTSIDDDSALYFVVPFLFPFLVFVHHVSKSVSAFSKPCCKLTIAFRVVVTEYWINLTELVFTLFESIIGDYPIFLVKSSC